MRENMQASTRLIKLDLSLQSAILKFYLFTFIWVYVYVPACLYVQMLVGPRHL